MNSGKQRGFTFVEVMVVMAIVALLLSLVVPRYFSGLDRAKETILKQDLQTVRQAIDDFYTDTGAYPLSLATLVDKKYLRSLPVDPLTESTETWLIVPAPGRSIGVYDIKSGAEGQGLNGSAYSDW